MEFGYGNLEFLREVPYRPKLPPGFWTVAPGRLQCHSRIGTMHLWSVMPPGGIGSGQSQRTCWGASSEKHTAPAMFCARANWSAGVTKRHFCKNDIVFMRSVWRFEMEMQARNLAALNNAKDPWGSSNTEGMDPR